MRAEPAKDCVRKMLCRDPAQRATALQVLKHDWMRENGVAADNPIQLEVLTRIKNFAGMNQLKKEALKVRRGRVVLVLGGLVLGLSRRRGAGSRRRRSRCVQCAVVLGSDAARAHTPAGELVAHPWVRR